MTKILLAARSIAFGAGLCSMVVLAADHINPNQAAIDALNDQKALLEAEESVAKAENALAKAQSEAFPDSFGKKGAVTLSGTDNVRVTAKTALALKRASVQLAELVKGEKEPVVLLTDADRFAIPLYRSERETAERLLSKGRDLLKSKPPEKAESAELLALGTLLSQIAQFTQLFRTDRTVTFVPATLPEDLLLELVAAAAPTKVLFPGADTDGLLAGNFASPFGKVVSELANVQDRLKSAPDKATKDAAVAVVAQIDDLLKRLTTVSETTKTLGLLTVLRGELASGYLEAANRRSMAIRILAQGGTTVKTESIWHSDRYYVSGNIVVAYRVVASQPTGSVIQAGIIVSDEPFARIPLE